jgi:acyl carrier protein
VATDTFEIVRSLIAEVCAVEVRAVTPEGRLVGFGLDSVRMLDLILSIETRLGVTVDESDPELGTVQTVADLVALVERRRSAAR